MTPYLTIVYLIALALFALLAVADLLPALAQGRAPRR